MNKQFAKKGTKLNKNMTNTESLQLHDLTVTNKLIIPIYVEPEKPANPKEGEIYLKYSTKQLMIRLKLCYILMDIGFN